MTEVIPPGDGANPNFLLPTPCHPQGQQREAAGKEGKGSFLGMARAEELTWDTTRFARLCFPLIQCLWRRCPSLPGAGIGIPAALEFLRLWLELAGSEQTPGWIHPPCTRLAAMVTE